MEAGTTMSEPEKKGSIWPWIIVPLGAFSVFFVLRECQHRIPPADHAAPAATTAAPEPAPAPQ
jgi:hypothetical protein